MKFWSNCVHFFLKKMPFEMSIWKMPAILSWPQCVNDDEVYWCFHVSPRTRLTNVFFITIQILGKFVFAVTPFLTMISLPIFVYATTALLSWHEQKFVAIGPRAFGWMQIEISIIFALGWKIVSEMGPWSQFVEDECSNNSYRQVCHKEVILIKCL